MSPSSGIALVITLILLAIITFLAITLLVVTRSEKGTVGVKADQTTAALAADAALERVKLDVLAPMIAFTNPNNYELLVSTNYVNPFGFFASLPGNGNPYTNVNYERTSAGAPLTSAQMLQNLENLLYDPRPPVFMTNRLAGPAGSNEFRYYRDENRNGQFDATGLLPVVDMNGRTNGVNNYFIGDPQWIGVLERPGFPHSPTNRFVSRYAFEAIPLSKTLDLNYIYDYSKGLSPGMARGNDSFFRNMGVGTWEINLAAFLVDLNTNFWQKTELSAFPAFPYNYSYNGANDYLLPNSGTAFEDALSLLAYRYSTQPPLRWSTPPHLFSVTALFGQRGVDAFARDFIDGYTHGPPMTNTSWQVASDYDTALPNPRVGFGWSGSDNPNHFFSTQDWFDRAKTTVNYAAGTPVTVPSFAERLAAATSQSNSYDHYTFTRLISQLSIDSAPETGKINLNYNNVDSTGNVVPNAATNFIPWTNAVQFFTSVATRLLANAGYSVGTKTQGRPFSFNNLLVSDAAGTSFSIQIWPTNFYTPSVHRLLQVAANLYDATTDRTFGSTATNGFPTVFRPLFFHDKTRGGVDAVYIVGFQEVTDTAIPVAWPGMRDVSNPGDRAVLATNKLNMVYGIPLVIGAKKGFPNFNEFSMETSVSVTRKLQFLAQKDRLKGVYPYATNQMYVVAISNVFGAEAWNSYSNTYPRGLQMIVDADMAAVVTNDLGKPLPLYSNYYPVLVSQPVPAWDGFNGNVNHAAASFRVPLHPSTNHFLFLTNSTYVKATDSFRIPLTGIFEQGQSPPFYLPHWWLKLNTRLRFILMDTNVSPNRIVDYVNLSTTDDPIDITYELMREGNCGASYNPPPIGGANAPDGMLWCTNRQTPLAPTFGTRLQIDVSLGNSQADWSKSQSMWAGSGFSEPDSAIDFFRTNFSGLGPLHPGKGIYQTNLFYSPFTPTRTLYIITSWQANDPLVHYTIGDLMDLVVTNHVQTDNSISQRKISNIGRINDRYEPWGGSPVGRSESLTKTAIQLKDPLVTRSDDWDFPTNKFPNIGWIGRVHRGTPWQTVYLKSQLINVTNWAKWTGNGQAVTNFGQINTNIVNLPIFRPNSSSNLFAFDALWTLPTNDWAILDLFTTAFNDNAARGRLGINQTNLAAWSAIFSGAIALRAQTNGTQRNPGKVFEPVVIQPVGTNANASQLWQLVAAINDVRRTNFAGSFRKLGDILAVPEFSDQSPFMNLTNVTAANKLWSVNDAVCERLPQQTLGLLALDPPRFLVFAYGQALKPAPRSIVTSGPFFNLCTNYQVTAEAATRTVFRIDGLNDKPPNPRIVIEKFSALPPD